MNMVHILPSRAPTMTAERHMERAREITSVYYGIRLNEKMLGMLIEDVATKCSATETAVLDQLSEPSDAMVEAVARALFLNRHGIKPGTVPSQVEINPWLSFARAALTAAAEALEKKKDSYPDD